jgi:hypothetical protein
MITHPRAAVGTLGGLGSGAADRGHAPHDLFDLAQVHLAQFDLGGRRGALDVVGAACPDDRDVDQVPKQILETSRSLRPSRV